MYPVMCGMCNVTCVLWHVSCGMYPVSCDMYHLACILCPVSCGMYPVSCDMYHLACILCPVTGIIWHVSCILYPVACIIWHVSCGMYPVSCDMYHVACILCPVTGIIWHVSCDNAMYPAMLLTARALSLQTHIVLLAMIAHSLNHVSCILDPHRPAGDDRPRHRVCSTRRGLPSPSRGLV